MSDQETKARRYTRWPIETLYENVGDSGCKSVLLAALFQALDHETVIVESRGRTAVGVGGADGLPGRFLQHKGKKYYYCEPMTPDRQIGQLPPELSDDRLWVYNIETG
jgi:hypothetical protein